MTYQRTARGWLAGACVGLAGLAATPAAADPVRIVVFPSTQAVPMFVAAQLGMFEAEGVTPEISFTRSSGQLMVGLVDGTYDIANAAIDNYIAYAAGQRRLDTTATAELVTFLSGSTSNLSLIVRPEVTGYADLAGGTVGVDAPNTAFAYVLYRMLENNGLPPGSYTVDSVGGTDQRFAAMRDSRVVAAIMTPDWVERSAEFGGHELESSLSAIGPYQSTSYAARRDWLDANRDVALGFIRAYTQAAAFAADPANDDELVRIVQIYLPNMTDAAARAGIAEMRRGLTADGRFDPAALETVMSLREQFGEPRVTLLEPSAYVDLSLLEEATR